MKPLVKILLLSLVLAFVLVGQTEAHGYIVRSSPADRSILSRSPNQVQIWFSEGLEPRFSRIEVFDQAGNQISQGGVDEQNSAKLVAPLPQNLAEGAYLVRLRPVFSGDGHAVSDTMVFWIGTPTGSVDAEGSANTAVSLEVVWRVLLNLALMTLLGSYWVYALLFRPVWGNPRWQLGYLPPRLMKRLSQLVWGALLLAIFMNVLALLQISISLFNTGLSEVMRDNLWRVVLEGSNFGDVWQRRMILLIMMLAIQVVAAQQSHNRPQSTHVLWLLNGFLTLLALGTVSQISHAAGLSFWANTAILVDFLHLVAVAVWVGGLWVIALTLRPALSPLTPIARGQALQAMLNRFSVVAITAVSVIVVTGIFSTFVTVTRPSDLTNTTYGLTLIAKWVLMLPLLGLGALHYNILSPERLLKVEHFFAKLPQTLYLEALFGLVILLAASTLPATPPPVPADSRQEVAVKTQSVEVEGYTVQLAVSPSAIGANSYDVTILEEGEPATLQVVRIRFYYPERGRYTDPLILDASEPGIWVGAGGDIDRAGNWDALVDFQTPEGISIRAAMKWKISTEVKNTRSPQLLNWLSALLVIGILTLRAAPFTYPYLTRLNWSADNVVIISLVTVLVLGSIIAGVLLLEASSERVRIAREPLPDYENNVFPDQLSILEGKDIYTNSCINCHEIVQISPNEFPTFSELLLENQQDEDLYRLLLRGRLGQHQYGLNLSESQRWALLNYLRMLE